MLRTQKGLTLIEVLIAAIILAIMAVAIAYMFGLGGGKLEQSNLQRQLVAKLEAKLEEIKDNPQKTWAEVQAGNNILVLDDRNTSDNPDDDVILTWTAVTVDDPANGTKEGEIDYFLWTVEILDKAQFTLKEPIIIKTLTLNN